MKKRDLSRLTVEQLDKELKRLTEAIDQHIKNIKWGKNTSSQEYLQITIEHGKLVDEHVALTSEYIRRIRDGLDAIRSPQPKQVNTNMPVLYFSIRGYAIPEESERWRSTLRNFLLTNRQ